MEEVADGNRANEKGAVAVVPVLKEVEIAVKIDGRGSNA
jgi:hypothetical protein